MYSTSKGDIINNISARSTVPIIPTKISQHKALGKTQTVEVGCAKSKNPLVSFHEHKSTSSRTKTSSILSECQLISTITFDDVELPGCFITLREGKQSDIIKEGNRAPTKEKESVINNEKWSLSRRALTNSSNEMISKSLISEGFNQIT